MFDEVDLSNESGNEWSDYDEKVSCNGNKFEPCIHIRLTAVRFPQAGTSVSIMEVESKIARA